MPGSPADATFTGVPAPPDAPLAALPPDPAAVPAGTGALPDRYEDRGLLGAGGMGEVRLVHDRVLDREVALKLVRTELSARADVLARFVAEAQATARLSHPGIVPVYDHGRAPDGRLYFTMMRVEGATLREAVEGAVATGGLGPQRRRLVGVLERAARAIGFAHAHGLVHRDLKPGNIILGEHGEVRVVDWGLAQVIGDGTPAWGYGTIGYVAPEVAASGVVDARGDVYALGVILGDLLGDDAPEELSALATQATADDPAARPTDGARFADALQAWLDGEGRREHARAHVRASRAHRASIAGLAAEERRVRAEATRLLAETPAWAPAEAFAAAWAAEDEADRVAREVAAAERAVGDHLQAALFHDPEAVDAHAELAERARDAQAQAEREGRAAEEEELRLRRHLAALPRAHPTRLGAERWLEGTGRLTLHTDPPGAHASLWRYVEVGRRLVAERVGDLGETPLVDVPLARGSWLVVLEAEGRAPVRYPVHLLREERWSGVPPGEDRPFAVPLPRVGELRDDEIYVPAGPARLGGDPDAPAGLPGMTPWVDGFVIQRFVVTNRAWITFLDALVREGREAEALRCAPRDRGRTAQAWGDVLYGRREDGGFALVTDAQGDTWDADWPVLMVDHAAAWAYARWLAATEGLPWRLPGELEWEKAARGVDGRPYPWGSFLHPAWCGIRAGFEGNPTVERVQARPQDESPYGVRGMAGGVVEWTADRMLPTGPPLHAGRVVVPDGTADGEEAWAGREATWRIVGRGGSRFHDVRAARAAFRLATDPWTRSSNVGVRVARPYPAKVPHG